MEGLHEWRRPSNTEALWNWEALFTDEIRSTDTFTQRQDADQRNLQTNDGVLTPIYNRRSRRAAGRGTRSTRCWRTISRPPASSTWARCT